MNTETVVLDTTVLAKGIVPPRRRKQDAVYEERMKLHESAKSFLKEVEGGKLAMHIPAIAIIETACVVARLTGKEQRGQQAAAFVRRHGNIVPENNLLEKAVEIGARTKISGFDSVFIASAVVTNSELITNDRKMCEAAETEGIAVRLLRDMT